MNWFQDDILNNQLKIVRNNMQNDLKCGNHYLDESVDYLLLSGGKMLRPLLLLIGSKFGKLYSKKESDIISLSTAIETLHVATLLHDDVIDEAKLRRGQESIQSKYSKEYAIYMGDYLLSKCFLLLTELQIPKNLAIRLAKVVSQICMGEISQNSSRYNLNVSIMKYLRNISNKTAALFSISLSAGSYVTKASENVTRKLANAGYQLGMAFQIVDDLLDFVGDEKTVGKDLKSDILQGYYCMPVLFSINDKSEFQNEIKELFNSGINKGNIDELVELIKKSGAIEKTRNLAKRYHQKAINIVSKLPENSGKDQLLELMPKLVERLY